MNAPGPAVTRPRAGQPRYHRGQRGGIFLKLLGLLLVAAVLFLGWLLRGPLLRATASVLMVDETPRPSDAIVVLGTDTFWGERAARGAELFHGRWAPRVIASGGALRPYASYADLMRRDLLDRGVPESAVVHFANYAASTREEAYAVRELLRQKGWRRILVVTSNYHTGRTRFLYRKVLDPGMEVRVVSARDSTFDPDSWWRSRLGWKTFLRECLAWTVALAEITRDDPSSVRPPSAPAGARERGQGPRNEEMKK